MTEAPYGWDSTATPTPRTDATALIWCEWGGCRKTPVPGTRECVDHTGTAVEGSFGSGVH